MSDDPRSAWMTPPEIAKELRCRTSKPIRWIEAGELPAVNVSEGTRPRYRVRRADLEAFLERRAVVPTPKPIRRERRDASIPRYV
jgi:excisionase family DNA binding protein